MIEDCIGLLRAGAAYPTRALRRSAAIYSIYLGGHQEDATAGIAVDALGNIYVTGTTASVDLPTSARAQQPAAAGGEDVFVTKLSPTGALLYSTYFGTACGDQAGGIAVDGAGNAYVTGRFRDVCPLPERAGVFVAKFDRRAALSFLGIARRCLPRPGIAVDAGGQAYITGNLLRTS